MRWIERTKRLDGGHGHTQHSIFCIQYNNLDEANEILRVLGIINNGRQITMLTTRTWTYWNNTSRGNANDYVLKKSAHHIISMTAPSKATSFRFARFSFYYVSSFALCIAGRK